jgi:hypothetical protein
MFGSSLSPFFFPKFRIPNVSCHVIRLVLEQYCFYVPFQKIIVSSVFQDINQSGNTNVLTLHSLLFYFTIKLYESWMCDCMPYCLVLENYYSPILVLSLVNFFLNKHIWLPAFPTFNEFALSVKYNFIVK